MENMFPVLIREKGKRKVSDIIMALLFFWGRKNLTEMRIHISSFVGFRVKWKPFNLSLNKIYYRQCVWSSCNSALKVIPQFILVSMTTFFGEFFNRKLYKRN